MKTKNLPPKPETVQASPRGLAPKPRSPVWRSSAFWHSDIEDIMDRIANDAMSYHPECRSEFFRNVMDSIKDHLANCEYTNPPPSE
jgi:hypothetical protein